MPPLTYSGDATIASSSVFRQASLMPGALAGVSPGSRTKFVSCASCPYASQARAGTAGAADRFALELPTGRNASDAKSAAAWANRSIETNIAEPAAGSLVAAGADDAARAVRDPGVEEGSTPVAPGFDRDVLVRRIEAEAVARDLERDRVAVQLAVHPVVPVPVGDVEIGGLLGGVAGRALHLGAHRHEGLVVDRVHVGREVLERVPVRVEDELGGGVEADPGRHVRMREHEVAHALVLGRRHRARAAVRLAAAEAARAAAAAPPVAVVAVVVRPDRVRVRLTVLAPELIRAGRDVELRAVRVQARHDVDLARVDELVDLG